MSNHENHIGIEIEATRSEVAGSPTVKNAPDDVHVLLRHRLRREPGGCVAARPLDDVLRAIDDRAVVEDKRGHLVVAGQTVYLSSPWKERIGSIAPPGLNHFGFVARSDQGVVRVTARVSSLGTERPQQT